jgi:hypothetical protein
MIDNIRVGRIKRESWLLRNEISLWQSAREQRLFPLRLPLGQYQVPMGLENYGSSRDFTRNLTKGGLAWE